MFDYARQSEIRQLRSAVQLQEALKKYFGYDEFRPLQQEIIDDALAGRDVFALLPTGGGKSLCFQLPALLRDGVTIVVSPLIALMKDQVDALRTSGIPATFLNSTLAASEARERFRGLHRNEFRLLYVAPERLMMENFLESTLNWNIAQIAIDEAHCISEWGHDFRPEYRELKKLRAQFPDVPIMALTATATKRVRDDIVKQLKLRQPRCYVASFNRPNLTYRVVPKSSAYQQVLDFVRARPNESGIVYCASRKSSDALAEKLTRDGIKALPYHAGMESKERTRNQEAFLRDDARVITATIAFGMGINKPNVRYVIHHDLPKNIEGYYQETGRAGRDGLPSECVLLFSVGDVVKQRRFIEEKSRKRAAHRARAIAHHGRVCGNAPLPAGDVVAVFRRNLAACFCRGGRVAGIGSSFCSRHGCHHRRHDGARRNFMQRLRQLPGTTRDVRRHDPGAKISLLRASSAGQARL